MLSLKRQFSLQLPNYPKSWRTLKKEIGYPRNGSSYTDLKNGTAIEKAEQNKLKQFAGQLKSVFVLVIAWFRVQLMINLTSGN